MYPRLWRLWVSTFTFLDEGLHSHSAKLDATIAKVHSKIFLLEWTNSEIVYLLMVGNEQKRFGRSLKDSAMTRSFMWFFFSE